MVLLIASDDREGVMVQPDSKAVASTAAFSQIVMVNLRLWRRLKPFEQVG